MSFQELFKKIERHYVAGLPFVVYHKPNDTAVNGFFQKDATAHYLNNYTQKGYVFAPFDSTKKAIIIPQESSEHYRLKFLELTPVCKDIPIEDTVDQALKEKHLDLVVKGVEFLKQGKAHKVVLSRKEKVSLANFSISNILKKLLIKYSQAMVYVWFHPESGLWMGATPETLLSVTNTQFATMALAGTQAFAGTMNVVWQRKELEEQQYVTDFIVSAITDNVSQLNVSDAYTVKAGNVVHLRTDISAQLQDENDLSLLIKKLHPTPAVCGAPMFEAQQFIQKNESYDREFYTGFLGELNLNAQTNLFVNLRCMKIENDQAHIFVGGGITTGSSAESEWQETVEKSKVIKKALAGS